MGTGQKKGRSYGLGLTAGAEKQFLALPKKDQLRIAGLIDGLAKEPRPPGVKKLHGAKALYGVRSGDYRVIYQVRDKVLFILVIRIANRSEAYRNLESILKGG